MSSPSTTDVFESAAGAFSFARAACKPSKFGDGDLLIAGLQQVAGLKAQTVKHAIGLDVAIGGCRHLKLQHQESFHQGIVFIPDLRLLAATGRINGGR